ncbi:hypothetical protein HGM15179_018259 [Zosterops borbonicus]|uniref:Uncharacterized protein n=1 Tax=Zosterops borbonicus TaxID=364589 RepID=A0A8K1LCE6_9PASS|nr:hypothetical protein HGM15179_018259 [Zosterops borbonicus]
MIPQVIREEMQQTDGPMIEVWTLPWTLCPRLSIAVKCAVINQAKGVKPLWYGGRWSKYKYGEAWQINYITLPQIHQGKRCVLTMVETTNRWLETFPVPHVIVQSIILGLEKQVLW